MGGNLELSLEKSLDPISYKQALNLLFRLARHIKLQNETLPIESCLGRVLSAKVESCVDNPPHNVSSMDGYAINSRNNVKNRVFRLVGMSAAGNPTNFKITSNEAVRIFTGAKLPEGSNTVIIQENVELIEKNKVLINPGIKPMAGENIRKKGTDFTKKTVIDKGKFISDMDIMLFAAMGHKELLVKKRLSISILSVGDELTEPGKICDDHKIYSSNAYGIASLLRKYSCQPLILPIARDNLTSIKKRLSSAITNSDLIVTSGGASVGAYDLVRKAAKELGLKVSFEKVNIRPGKPTFAGLLKDTPILGLPGNPVSSYVCARLFLIPLIGKISKCKENYPIISTAKLSSDLKSNGSRRHFLRANIIIEDGEQIVYPKNKQDSSLVKTLQESNCLIIRAPNDNARVAGQTVDILKLY